MGELISYKQEELAEFVLMHLKNNLSGTSVLMKDQVMDILTSVKFVLAHSIKGKSVKEQFESGKKEILKLKNRLEEESHQLREVAIFKVSQSYQKTFDEFDRFFESYDLNTKAHETGAAWFDYQLAHPLDDQLLKGIDFVKAYLESLTKESQFVALLPKQIVAEILTTYDANLLIDYRIDVNNLYEVVFNQVVAKVLTAKTITTTGLLSTNEKSYLLNQKTLDLSVAFKKIIDSDPYYQKSFLAFKKMLQEEKGNRLLIRKNDEKEEIIFTEPLTEEKFLLVVKKANQLEGKEKIEWLVKTIQSPYDLTEVYLGIYFTPQEWQLFFKKMSNQLLFQYVLLIKQQSNGEVTSFFDLLRYEGVDDIREFKEHLEYLSTNQQKELDDLLRQVSVPKQDLD